MRIIWIGLVFVSLLALGCDKSGESGEDKAKSAPKSPKELCEANDKEENWELCTKMMEGVKTEIGDEKWDAFSECVDGNNGDDKAMETCFKEAGMD